jgi:2-hydroxychromene-2-carboxylate isomerase
MATVNFWFDPSCYWSWRAARWLMDAAEQRDFDIDWRPFSLAVLYGEEMNPDWRSMLEGSHRALRVVQALREKHRSEDLTRFYIALGTALHEDGKEMDDSTVREAAEASGVADAVDALHDEGQDAQITSSFDEAMATAGPDVGSPVIEIPGAPRGIYGPVLAEVPPREEAGALFDAIALLARSPVFYELKRGH